MMDTIKKKKVVLMAPTPPPYGGIASWTDRIINSKLYNENVSLSIIDEKVIGRGVFKKGRKNFVSEIKRLFKIWGDLKKNLKSDTKDLVHICIPAYLGSLFREYISIKIAKRKKVKTIIHFRCTLPNMITSKLHLFLFLKILKHVDGVIVLNSKSFDFVKKYSNVKTTLIPNFILENESGKVSEIKDSISSAIYVGGVIPEKGVNEIIDASTFFPEITFYLVGENFSNYESRGNLIFTGSIDRLKIGEYLISADIFLFPTYFEGEGFSNALLEAMAVGLPCIATDWAANKDMLDNKGGIIIKHKDITSLVNAINTIKPKSIRKSMSHFNLEKVKDYFEDKIISCYLDFYNQI